MGNTNKRISIHEPLQKVPIFAVPYEENGPESTQKEAGVLMEKKRSETKAKNYMIIGTDRFHDFKIRVQQTDPIVELVWKIPLNGDLVKNIRLRNGSHVQQVEMELSDHDRDYILFTKEYSDMEEPRDIWIGPPEVPLPLIQLHDYKIYIRLKIHRDHLLPYYTGQAWLEADYLHCTPELHRWLSSDVELELPEYYMRIKQGEVTLVEDCTEEDFGHASENESETDDSDEDEEDEDEEEETESESEEEITLVEPEPEPEEEIMHAEEPASDEEDPESISEEPADLAQEAIEEVKKQKID
jgi:hypothetical protein